MADTAPIAVSISNSLAAITPLIGRTPATTETGWVATLGQVGDAGIFLVDYAGTSEWERHPEGDEIVMVLDGQTTITMMIDGEDRPQRLGPMELVVVPRGTWHRFETPGQTQIMTVTPQPSDHSVERPIGG